MRGSWHRAGVLLAVAAAAAAGSAISALYVQFELENVPIERATANLERMIQEQPSNVGWRINLARIHAMAFAQKAKTVPIVKNEQMKDWKGQPFFGYGPDYKQFNVISAVDAAIAEAAAKHLQAAVAAYRDVLKVAPENSVAGLGLGWALSLAGDKTGAIEVLRQVAAREWPREEKTLSAGYGEPSMVEETARYLIPLLDPTRDAAEIDTLRQRAAVLARKARFITPIAIPLRPNLTAIDITSERAHVLFDADGSGIPKRWTWITPDAAWLVFDKKDTREITSALQWFGNVTFWMFWENGYDALRVLDDDNDGSIRGSELRGLALWHDRDGDGVSDKGEVRPLAEHGVVSLSTNYEYDARHPDEIAWSNNGVTFTSGEVRPTFDLVLRTGVRPGSDHF
jgi:hypothetical protein